MAQQKTIAIQGTKPQGHDAIPIATIVLREPKYADFIALGEPTVWTPGPNGIATRVDVPEVIGEYVERCLVEPKDHLLLRQLDLVDAMAVRDAVVGFFIEAEARQSPPPATS